MTLLDIAIILAFIIYAITSGLKNKDDASKNLEEYFLAGRSLPGRNLNCFMFSWYICLWTRK